MQKRIDFAALARQVLRDTTTRQLGIRIGLSQPSVSRLASGKTTSISADAAVELIYVAGGHIHVPAAPEAAVEEAHAITA